MRGDKLEIILKKLQELKQENKEIEDFLLEFKNLHRMTNIAKEHAMEILQQNAKWMLVEKAITHYGPPTDYDNLKNILMMVGAAEEYLSTIKQPMTFPCHLTR